MSLTNFSFNKDKESITIEGGLVNLDSLKKFLDILNKINIENNIKKVNIYGNFNTKFLMEDLITSHKKDQQDSILEYVQSVTKTIEDSNTIFIANLNDIIQGPALEISLSCNSINADRKTIFKINEIEKGFIPIFGSIQRLLRIIGYKKTLEILLLKKAINFDDAKKLDIINSHNDNNIKIKNSKFFWDNSFTNTFIFYNSLIHSKTKNTNPAYNATLSSIFEGSICDYNAGLSVEKRWVKWLLNQQQL